MKNITKDEIYCWMPCTAHQIVYAKIPDDLHQRLCDSIAHYDNVCKMIYDYLEEHPDDEIKT